MAATSAVAIALASSSAAPAQAISQVGVGGVKLCNGSSYRAYLNFDTRGYNSPIVEPGQCWRGQMSNIGRRDILVWAGIDSTGKAFLIFNNDADFRTEGMGVTVKGTPTSRSFTIW